MPSWFPISVLKIGTNNLGDLRLLTALRAPPLSKCSEQRFSSLDFWLLFINGKVTLKISIIELNINKIDSIMLYFYFRFFCNAFLN